MLYGIVAFCVIACEGRRSKLRVESSEDAQFEVAEVAYDKRTMPAKPIERRLIKKGSVEFQTKDWKTVKKKMAVICDSLGAYAADESLNNFHDRISYHQILRVPSHRFEELVNMIERLSGGFSSKSINVDDVTEEYIDIEVVPGTRKKWKAVTWSC
jgi:hypothetical protein